MDDAHLPAEGVNGEKQPKNVKMTSVLPTANVTAEHQSFADFHIQRSNISKMVLSSLTQKKEDINTYLRTMGEKLECIYGHALDLEVGT